MAAPTLGCVGGQDANRKVRRTGGTGSAIRPPRRTICASAAPLSAVARIERAPSRSVKSPSQRLTADPALNQRSGVDQLYGRETRPRTQVGEVTFRRARMNTHEGNRLLVAFRERCG